MCIWFICLWPVIWAMINISLYLLVVAAVWQIMACLGRSYAWVTYTCQLPVTMTTEVFRHLNCILSSMETIGGLHRLDPEVKGQGPPLTHRLEGLTGAAHCRAVQSKSRAFLLPCTMGKRQRISQCLKGGHNVSGSVRLWLWYEEWSRHVSSLDTMLYHIKLPSVLWHCWLGSRKGIRPVKTAWWDAGVVICLGRGADLHIAQLMPLSLTVSCSSNSRLILPFWYRLTHVVSNKGPLNGCCCCFM